MTAVEYDEFRARMHGAYTAFLAARRELDEHCSKKHDTLLQRVFHSPDLRLVAVMLIGVAACGIIDGSQWHTIFTPTLAYRPAFLFGLALVFGWRGLVWSQLIIFAEFASVLHLRAAVSSELLFGLSNVSAFMLARKIAGREPWLSREKSTLALLAGAAVAPAVPALLQGNIGALLGFTGRFNTLGAIELWLRGAAGILAIVPAILIHSSGRVKQWIGLLPDRAWFQPFSRRNLAELCVEVVAWSATLWITVQFKARYGMNVTYLTFLPPVAFALFNGMRLATLALAANAIVATTLWELLNWSSALSSGDLRLLIAIYSLTILVLASVVDDRQRKRKQIGELLVSEQVLRESEQYFRTLADSAPLMMWMSGPDKQCRFVNRQVLEFSGRSLDQFLGNGWAEAVYPADAGHYAAQYASAFDARQRFQSETRFRRFDGEYRWLLVHAAPVYRAQEFAGYIGSCLDITPQKIVTQRLEESEAQLAYAQSLTRVGSFEWRLAGNEARWSQQKLRMMGLSEAPPDLAAWLRYVHPDDRSEFLGSAIRVRSGKDPAEVEYRIVRPNGQERVIRSIIDGIRNESGALVRIVGASQDVTEEVFARDRLFASQQQLEMAQQLARIGSWQWDLESDHVSCSEECIRIFGRRTSCGPGFEGLLRIVIPRDKQRVTAEIGAVAKGRMEHTTEFQIAWPGGEFRTIKWASRLSLSEKGIPRRVFGVCQDITDIRRTQEEAFARQKLETIGTMASGVAHQFNNLMKAIVAQAERAGAELNSGASPNQELEAIRDIAIGGSKIVRELMIYAGTENEKPVPTDISAVLPEMLEFLESSASRHAKIETHLAAQLPPILASPARLTQLILNLVMNASDAIGDRDGVIRITTRAGQAGHVQLEILDTGCGMPPEVTSRVLDPFFSTKSNGRGLGLSIVDAIVRGLNGSIYIESEPGKGTIVRTSFPVAQNSLQPLP